MQRTPNQNILYQLNVILLIAIATPFLIPFLIFIFFGKKLKKFDVVRKISNFLLNKSFLFWLLQAAGGYLFRHKFVENTGIVLTLIIPNIFYLFAYFPFFTSEGNYSLRKVIFETVLCVISTLIFWSFVVNAYNWKEGALLFAYLIPALIAMSFYTAIVLIAKIRNGTIQSN